MQFDYTSMGFYTFDALCRPVSDLPPGGRTYFVDAFTLAVSGAAGSAAIVAAKHGLKVQAVGGVGQDDMGDWVMMKLAGFGIDTALMQRCPDHATSSSIVTTRPDGARRLADRLAIDTHPAGADQPGGQAPGLEKARLPKPLVQPDRLGRVGHSVLNPASAAANGLSGSIGLSFFGGRASNWRCLSGCGLPPPLAP